MVKERDRLHLWIPTRSLRVRPLLNANNLTLESTYFNSILSHLLVLRRSITDLQSIVMNATILIPANDLIRQYALERRLPAFTLN